MKIAFSGRCFLVRYVIGAMITQAALLISAYPISLSGKYEFIDLANIIMTTWSYKIVMAIILLPVAVFLVRMVKKIEKTDHYDWGTSYNPLKAFSSNK